MASSTYPERVRAAHQRLLQQAELAVATSGRKRNQISLVYAHIDGVLEERTLRAEKWLTQRYQVRAQHPVSAIEATARAQQNTAEQQVRMLEVITGKK